MPALVTTAKKQSALQLKFAEAAQIINSALIERHNEVELALTGLLANEHVLFVGLPGTAKSMLLDSIIRWIGSSEQAFSELLGKFTTPENVFGPISLSGMKKDDYRRVTTGYLPSCHFAFLDEIFKASSAILNTMLKVLNERTFRNGSMGVTKCPLRFCVAASNEWPGGEGQDSLAALFDRFVIRSKVAPIATMSGMEKLLFSDNLTPEFNDHLTLEELDDARAEVTALPWSEDAKKGIIDILMKLKGAGIIPGDRRKRKCINIARAYAWLNGADQVEVDHLMVLSNVLWDDPIEQPAKAEEIIAQIANPLKYALKSKLQEAHGIMSACNTSDYADSVTATAKLTEILKGLKNMKDSPQTVQAVEHVQSLIRDIKLAQNV